MDSSRINRLIVWVKKKGLDVLWVEDPVDLYYLTGISFSLGKMAITQKEARLFVDGRYIAAAQKAPCPAFLPSEFKNYMAPFSKAGFDSAFVSFDQFQNMKNKFPNLEWIPVSSPLKDLRLIKDAGEIALLKKAAKLTFQGYKHIASLLKEGVSEEELSLEFEIFCRKNGASKLSFSPIVAFGENSAYPHHRAGKTRLKKDQIVLFDLGAVVEGYAGDLTRVDFFGKAPKQLVEDYELIRSVQKKVVERIAPKVRFGDLDLLARGELEKMGCGKLFTHGLSHGIGLDVHEYPSLRHEEGDKDLMLEEGMVFTVEPGIYREGLGGVRYEDVVLVTKKGHEVL